LTPGETGRLTVRVYRPVWERGLSDPPFDHEIWDQRDFRRARKGGLVTEHSFYPAVLQGVEIASDIELALEKCQRRDAGISSPLLACPC